MGDSRQETLTFKTRGRRFKSS